MGGIADLQYPIARQIVGFGVGQVVSDRRLAVKPDETRATIVGGWAQASLGEIASQRALDA